MVPIPEGGESGDMDPRAYAQKRMMPLMVKALELGEKSLREETLLAMLRRELNRYKGAYIADGGTVTAFADAESYDGRAVPLRIYRRAGWGEGRPMVVYFHGGGFVGGSPAIVEQLCKLLVQKLDCVVVSADYRLCPENRWPAPPEDCWAAVRWAAAHAGEHGGDGRRLAVAGDSAGGNLASLCALRDCSEGRRLIGAQLLLYPVTNLGCTETKFYHGVDVTKYQRSARHAGVIDAVLRSMMPVLDGHAIPGMYLQGRIGADDPAVSPAMAEASGLPPALLCFGEHDLLAFDNIAYAAKLKAAGVPCATVVYRGLGHGFADQVGVMPQAADCVCRMAEFLRENI